MMMKRAVVLCCGAWLMASAAAQDGGGGALSACLIEDNPPFSRLGADTEGIDVEAARLIAQKLGRPLRVVWVQVPARGGFGKALKESIQSGKCDFFAGVPAGKEMADELRQHKLVSTRPYLGVGYLLVSPPGSRPAGMADAKRARRVGAASATPADLFLHKEHLHRIPYANNQDLLAALRGGALDMALVWTPALAVDPLRQSGAPVAAAEQPTDPDLRTGLAFATRATDAALMRAIDAAIVQLQQERQWSALAGRYGLPTMALD
jgi:ABC-type amino acid transport substrate-binding protein